MVAKLPGLAVAVILPGKRHAVGSPRQQAAILHQHRRVPGAGVRIAGEFRRALHHLLRRLTVVPLEWVALRPLAQSHAHHPLPPAKISSLAPGIATRAAMRNPLPDPVRTAKGYSGLSVPWAPGTDALADRAF